MITTFMIRRLVSPPTLITRCFASAGLERRKIEQAKSGRSKCRLCKDAIPKGKFRIGSSPEIRDGWYHPQCFGELVGSETLTHWEDDGDGNALKDILRDDKDKIDVYADEIIQILEEKNTQARKAAVEKFFASKLSKESETARTN